MPTLNFTGINGAEEARISSFYVKEGDQVKKGEKLLDIEADKASDTINSPYDGKIVKIHFASGDVIKIGDVMIDFAGASDAVGNSPAPSAKPKPTTSDLDTKNPEYGVAASFSLDTTTPPAPVASNIVLSTPLARKIAYDLKIDLRLVTGTGPRGRVLCSDIEEFCRKKQTVQDPNQAVKTMTSISQPQVSASSYIAAEKIASFGVVEYLPLTAMRKAIAQQMSLSKYTAPHVTLMIDVDATNLINLRATMKEMVAKPENGGVRLTITAFFVKAVAKVLTEEKFKLLNSTLDIANNRILVKKYYHIGMATDTEKGLVVPVINNADKMTLLEVARAVNSLADQARKGQLKAADMQGASFTITNFGSAGLKYGTPIINYPEVAILGIGALEEKVGQKDGKLVIYKSFPLSLSIDHRVIDGAPAGYFMQRLKNLLENPTLIIA